MKIQINKENLKLIGDAGLLIGKRVLIEGTKAVIIKSVVATVEASFEDGLDGIKAMSFEDALKGHGTEEKREKAKNKKKKTLFKKKEKVVLTKEDIEDILGQTADDVVFKGEIVD